MTEKEKILSEREIRPEGIHRGGVIPNDATKQCPLGETGGETIIPRSMFEKTEGLHLI